MSVCTCVYTQAAAMAWMHKTVVTEYDMDKNQEDDVGKYQRTDAYSPNGINADMTIPSSPTSQMSDP